MSKTLCQASFTTVASTANTTQYWAIAGIIKVNSSANEARSEVKFRSAGVLSGLIVKLSANSVAGSGSTFTLRKNGASVTQTLAIGASATGDFEDTTHTDAVADADRFCLETDPIPTTGTFSMSLISLLFDATTNTVTKLAKTDPISSTSASTSYQGLHGGGTVNATESNVESRMRKAGTFKKLGVYVSAARATNTTLRLRKDNANGNNVVTITGGGAAGWYEDTSSTDTVGAGEDWNYTIVPGSGSDSLGIQAICCEFESTAGDGLCILTNATDTVSVSDNTTRFFYISGTLIVFSGETGATGCQTKARAAFVFSELTCNISANDVGSNSTLTLRKGAADTTLLATITANTPGVYSDTTHTETVTTTDQMSLECTVPSVSGSHSITVKTITMVSHIDAGTNFDRPLSTETVTVGSGTLDRVLGAIRGPSDTTSVSDDLQRSVTNTRTIDESSISVGGGTLDRILGAARTISEAAISAGDDLVRAVTNTRTLPETTNVSDDAQRAVTNTRTLSDNTGSTDDLQRTLGYPRELQDTTGVGDDLQRSVTNTRALPESVSVGDQLTKKLDFFRSLVESAISVVDDLTRSLNLTKSLPENTSVGDSVDRTLGASRNLPETTGTSDDLQRAVTNTRTLPETTSVNDQVDRTYGALRTLPETTVTSDDVQRSVTNTRTLPETTGTSDQLDRQYAANREITESSVAVNDSVSVSQVLTRTITEAAISVNDQLVKVYGAIRSLPETVVSSDLVDRLYGALRTLGDTVGITDDIDAFVTPGGGANFDRPISDSVSVGDQVDRSVANTRNLSDSTSVNDDVTRSVTMTRILTEASIVVGDQLGRVYSAIRSLPDTVASNDTVNTVYAAIRSLSDTVGITDQVDRSVDVTRQLPDTVASSDQVNRSVTNTRDLSDSVGTTDQVDRSVSFARNLLDTVGVTGFVSKSMQFVRNLIESVPMLDTLLAIVEGQINVKTTDMPILITKFLQDNWTDDPESTAEHYLIPPKSKITFGSRFDMSAGTHSDMHVHVRNVSKNIEFIDTAGKIEDNSAIVSIYAEVRYIPDTPPDFSGENAGAPSDMMWQIRSYITELIRSDPEQLFDSYGIEVISIMQEVPDANTPVDVHAQNVIENMYTIIIIAKCFYTLEVDRVV